MCVCGGGGEREGVVAGDPPQHEEDGPDAQEDHDDGDGHHGPHRQTSRLRDSVRGWCRVEEDGWGVNRVC